MNPDSINRWLSVLANFGVLIGIVVVVIEINQNTIATQTETAWARAQWVLDFNNPRSTDADLAELENRFSRLSEEEILQIVNSDEVYRMAVRVIMDRVYQETRFLTRTSAEDRGIQREQMLRDCAPYRWIVMDARGYADLDPEFAEFLHGVVEEWKTSKCSGL